MQMRYAASCQACCNSCHCSFTSPSGPLAQLRTPWSTPIVSLFSIFIHPPIPRSPRTNVKAVNLPTQAMQVAEGHKHITPTTPSHPPSCQHQVAMNPFTAEDNDRITERSSRRSCLTCLKITPWMAFLSMALFVAGLVLWAVTAMKTKEASLQFAEAIGVSAERMRGLERMVLTSILAIGISGVSIVGLVLLLAFVRTAQRSMVKGICCSGEPHSWAFSLYRAVNVLLTFLMWLLLLVVVGLLMVHLLWLGGGVAVGSAVDRGTSAVNTLLQSRNITAASASEASQQLLARFSTLMVDPLLADAAAEAPFQIVCPPTCLNLGSFAPLLGLESSCICDMDRLMSLKNIAQRGARLAGVALAGAAAMYCACTFLLMVLTAHNVIAFYDREYVRGVQERRTAAYEAGFKAGPRDLVGLPTQGSMSRSVSGVGRTVPGRQNSNNSSGKWYVV